MICNELDAENAEQTERNLDKVFLKGEKLCMRQVQKHRKEHKRTSSRDGRRQSHLC